VPVRVPVVVDGQVGVDGGHVLVSGRRDEDPGSPDDPIGEVVLDGRLHADEAEARSSCVDGLAVEAEGKSVDADDLDGLGDVEPVVTRTLMSDEAARRRLAEIALGVVPA